MAVTRQLPSIDPEACRHCLGYLGQTGQIASRQRASSTLATTWSYLNNAGDRRLAGVANTGLVAGHFSNYTFTSTPEDFVASVTETSDATAVYPPTGSQTATYNSLNQLTNLSGQALTWDTVGNVTSDGQRTYTWDAENRLVGIGYPGQPGKATAFAYDGLGRRVSITETPPGGGTPVTTNYLWCGDALCQARDGSNATTRSYYDEGEFVPGSPGQPYYYGIDQLGSVRRAFASTTSAPAYTYDPYGAPLAGPAPVTDFGFAGLFNHQPSGLNLTLYRVYDPVAGRWLSRDPIGEAGDPYGNLYAYVGSDTPNLVDPLGENPLVGAAFGAAAGGGARFYQELRRTGGNFSCVDWNAVGRSAITGAGIGAGVGVLAKILQRVALGIAGRAAASRAVPGNPQNVASAGKLAQQLRIQSANSPFTPRGTLTPDPTHEFVVAMAPWLRGRLG